MDTVTPTPVPDNGVDEMPAGHRMSAKAVTADGRPIPFEAFFATKPKWTVQGMIDAGYIERVPAGTYVPPPPKTPHTEDTDTHVDDGPTREAINRARDAEAAIDLVAAEEELPTAEAELQRACQVFESTKKLGNQENTHAARKWVKNKEDLVARLKEIIGDKARPRPAVSNPGEYIGSGQMPALFKGFTYVIDLNRIIGPSGFVYDSARFDAHPKFAARNWQMDFAAHRPTKSAWEAFLQSDVQPGAKVDQCYFDPRDPPGHIKRHEDATMVNTWRPIPIRMVRGDVTLFLDHLKILFPNEWRLLLNCLRFMMQHKGVKIMWWPFIQGVPGNGKSFISDTMEYCMGLKFTQRPTPKNIDSNFNASLYGCLFLALEDIKETDDFGKMWDTIKPLVTQKRIEIEPKGVDKVAREVCFNGIMNSNHKTGVKKDEDDRRIATFFSAQQRRSDLERDGLTKEYFDKLWGWAFADGWAHVAHFLLTTPIDADFSHTKCPVTSSTAEHIRLSRPAAQQTLLAAVRALKAGFKGGWLNMLKFHEELTRDPKTRFLTTSKEQHHAEALGYVPHPGLPEGQLTVALPDGTQPVLYVTEGHPTRDTTNPAAVAAAYTEAQK